MAEAEPATGRPVPRGDAAPPAATASAIVVEGGGQRGIFSAGVLDVVQERGFQPFQLALGTSAGACNLSSWLAEQHERNYRCYLRVNTRPQAIDPWRALRGGRVMDLDWLWNAFAREEPLDVGAVMRSPVRLVVSMTHAHDGAATYFAPSEANLLAALKASCAIPFLSHGAVEVDGTPYFDGAIAAALPVEEAWRRGARRIMVLRSRAPAHREKPGLESLVGALLVRRRPGLAGAIRSAHVRYQRTLDFIRQPPAGCQVIEVAPARPLRSHLVCRDPAVLHADYLAGRGAGERAIADWTRAAGA